MIFCQTVYADTSVIGTEDGGQFATDLDFESAATFRDKIIEIKKIRNELE